MHNILYSDKQSSANTAANECLQERQIADLAFTKKINKNDKFK
jgi:hypothetical protein